jgi:rSAM/selenodomain-associated transferase 1
MRAEKAKICAMAVMAKAPQAGRSKTRLVPPLLPEQAARLSAAFLRDITENIALAGRQQRIYGCIAYAPRGLEALFDGHLAAGTGIILADGAAPMPERVQGFGCCLLQAIRSLLAEGYDSVCVINADSPTLPTGILLRAAEWLAKPGDRAVLGPAEDGGYYLLGLKQAHARLFEDIAWSTGNVAAQTEWRAREIGLELVTLPPWYDVDDAASLHRLTGELERGPAPGGLPTDAAPGGLPPYPAPGGLPPYPAPATAACLQTMRLPVFAPTGLRL